MNKRLSNAVTVFCAAALMLSSCAKDDNPTFSQYIGNVLTECTLSANVNCIPSENPDGTKVSINADGLTPNWEEGDRILVLDADKKPLGDNGIFTLETGAGNASASFSGKKYSKQTAMYAIYPASAATIADDGTVVSGVMSADDGTISGAIMLGHSSDGTSVSFINACAVLKINTGDYGKTGGDPAIKSIGVSASYGEVEAAITGGFDIDWGTLSLSPIESLKSTGLGIALHDEQIGANKDIFIPIFPLETTEGGVSPSIQINFMNVDNGPAEVSYVFSSSLLPGVVKYIGSAKSLVFKTPVPGSDVGYLLFEAPTEHSIQLLRNVSSVSGLIYSYDLNLWYPIFPGSSPLYFGGAGNKSKIYIQGVSGTPINGFRCPSFIINGDIVDVTVSGNIMALVSPEYVEESSLASMGDNNGFQYLFKGCDVICDISDLVLPATTLAGNCYDSMFYGCTGLKSLPSGLLPATTLAGNCYDSMFYGCTGLKSLPSGLLSAITLADYSCYRMFYGCTGLTSLPSGLLPATTLAQYCYSSMFYGCTGLTSLPSDLLPATTLAPYCYSSMFYGCKGLTVLPEALLSATTLAANCCYSMFSGCTGLTSLSSGLLPATTLAAYCYDSMFYGCKGLTSLPSDLLPATTLAEDCCYRMFYGCTGLTSLPSGLLPATTLAPYCYSSMFSGCTGLTSTPALPATTLAQSCYSSMFSGCTGLTSTPALPATTLADYSYSSMFYGCTGLTSTPALPATTLAQSCYSSMFSGCTGLTALPETLLPATTLAQSCYSSMFSGCTGLTSVPSVSALTFGYRCCASMFKNCTSLVDGPDIIPLYDDEGLCHFTTYCFDSMFSGCSKLRSVRMNLGFYDKDSADDIIRKVFENWLSGVSSTGTLYCPVGRASFFSELAPTGWTISDTLTP